MPWVLAKLSWQVSRKRWRQSIKACRSGQELVPLLAAFNAALHRNTPRPGAGGGSRGSRAGGMALLLEALAAEISAGRETHRMLDARWDEARADIEAWLELEVCLAPACQRRERCGAALSLGQPAAISFTGTTCRISRGVPA